MANYIVNGDFYQDLEGWRNIENHAEVKVEGAVGARYAAFVANAQLTQARSVAVPRTLKFSMDIEVGGGSGEISTGIQIIIGYIDAGQPHFNGFAVREFDTWQKAEIDLDLGVGEGTVDFVVRFIVQPDFTKPVSITNILLEDSIGPCGRNSTRKLNNPVVPENLNQLLAKA